MGEWLARKQLLRLDTCMLLCRSIDLVLALATHGFSPTFSAYISFKPSPVISPQFDVPRSNLSLNSKDEKFPLSFECGSQLK